MPNLLLLHIKDFARAMWGYQDKPWRVTEWSRNLLWRWCSCSQGVGVWLGWWWFRV